MEIIKFILSIIAVIVNGYVLSILWKWFMVPNLGLPLIGIPQAIGIAIIMKLLTTSYNTDLEEEDANEDNLFTQFAHIIVSFLFLLIGYITQLFM